MQQKIWERDNGKCVKCGSKEGIGYDHLNPISNGGSDTIENFQLLCEKCNKIRVFRCMDYINLIN